MRSATGASEATDPGAVFDAACTGAATEVPYKAEMESAFGQSFDNVSAFVNRAAELAPLNAEGAAVGETVAFAEANPSKHVVAHELTHVVQARRGDAPSGPQLRGRASTPDEAAEVEAEAVATRVAAGLSAGDVGATVDGSVFLRRTLSVSPLPPAVNWSLVPVDGTIPEQPRAMQHGGIAELESAKLHVTGCHVPPKDGNRSIGDGSADKARRGRARFVADYHMAHGSMVKLASEFASFDDPANDPALGKVFALEAGRDLEGQLGDSAEVSATFDTEELSGREQNKLAAMAGNPKIAALQKEVDKADERVSKAGALCAEAGNRVKGQAAELRRRVLGLKIVKAEDDKAEADGQLAKAKAARDQTAAAIGLLVNASVAFVAPIGGKVGGEGGARRAVAGSAGGLLANIIHSREIDNAKRRVDAAISKLRSLRGAEAMAAVDSASDFLAAEMNKLSAARAGAREALINRRQKFDLLSEAMLAGRRRDPEAHKLSNIVRSIPKVEAIVAVVRANRSAAAKRPTYTVSSGYGYAIANKAGYQLVNYAFIWNVAQLRHFEKLFAQKETLWAGRLSFARNAAGQLKR